MIGERERIKKFLLTNRGYLKVGAKIVSLRVFDSDSLYTINLVKEVQREIRNENKVKLDKQVEIEDKPFNHLNYPNFITHKHQNVLILADLHAPWILDGYLEWCYELGKEYKTNKTIFIGDCIDAHAWNFHEHNPDGMSVVHELDAAIKQLKLAYKLFPEAEITLGNHDLLIARKARSAGLSQRFIRDFGSVLEAPDTWNFQHQFKYHNVNYIHGSIGNAFKRATESRTSTVQGHLHSQAFIQYSVSEKDAVWGLQLGAGMDHKAYAFDYAVSMTKKPIVSAGLVLENGEIPLLRLMKL